MEKYLHRLQLINDYMFNDLQEYWQNKNNENIFTNEKLTWYDPTAGMGKFPYRYLL